MIFGSSIALRTNQTMLRGQIREAFQNEWNDLYESVKNAELSLQHKFESSTHRRADLWEIQVAFVLGVWASLVCCAILALCYKVYRGKRKKRHDKI